MSKIDYNYKSEIINSRFYDQFISAQRTIDNYHWLGIYGDDEKYYSSVNDEKFLLKYQRAFNFLYGSVIDNKYSPGFKDEFPKEFKECQRIYLAYRSRVQRLRKRITNIVNNGDCIFLTLTFNNDSLSSLSAKTRREYVQRFLSSLDCFDYVANIDFGKKRGREHYHAVVGCSHVDYKLWNYGAVNGVRIRNKTDDVSRISRYISKLVNHAIKETTKRCAILYKRLKH